VLAAHRAGDLEAVRAAIASWSAADLLVLGAVADAVRTEDVGPTVHVYEHASSAADVTWVEPVKGASELDLLRAVAVARIAASKGARIGIDWSQCGMELAQVALGFGASDLRGPITRKSGLPIYEDEKLKVKGQGMVELRSIKKREIAALVTHAGRLPVFVDDAPRARESVQVVAQNV
jgi:2-iminoacetate synthase ThiH